jgi:ABC-type uncharacterized transport system permease subunit
MENLFLIDRQKLQNLLNSVAVSTAFYHVMLSCWILMGRIATPVVKKEQDLNQLTPALISYVQTDRSLSKESCIA